MSDSIPTLVALTRGVSDTIHRCELTHLQRIPIDAARAQLQHRDYERVLAQLGCRILRLPPAPDMPDAVFVEDTCLVFDEVAVVTRPGAESRRAELTAVADAMQPFRKVEFINQPGTLDGGDVVCMGRRVFVGCSSRTNLAGINQLNRLLARHDYGVYTVPFTDALHLKSIATVVAEKTILVDKSCVDPDVFGSVSVIEIDPSESHAANALQVRNTIVFPAAFPKTLRRLERHGLNVIAVDMDELAKAEGGVTCCCVIFRDFG